MSGTDLISRQAAIDVVHKVIFDFFDIRDDDEESPMTYKDKQLFGVNKDISTQIKALPSAQPEIIRCKDCVNYLDERCLVANHHVAGFSCCLDVFGAERKGEQP